MACLKLGVPLKESPLRPGLGCKEYWMSRSLETLYSWPDVGSFLIGCPRFQRDQPRGDLSARGVLLESIVEWFPRFWPPATRLAKLTIRRER